MCEFKNLDISRSELEKLVMIIIQVFHSKVLAVKEHYCSGRVRVLNSSAGCVSSKIWISVVSQKSSAVMIVVEVFRAIMEVKQLMN